MIDFDRCFTYDGQDLKGYSLKHLKAQYREERQYQIVGEIVKRKADKVVPMIDSRGKTLYAEPLGTHNALLYRTYAYIPLKDDNYLAAKKSNLLYGLFGVLLLAVLMGTLILNLTNSGISLDPNAKDYTSSLKRPPDWDESSILIPGYEELKMVADSDVLSAVLYNPKENPCYFRYEIILEESKESLYESGLLAPGKAVESMKLSKKLKRGVYAVTIKIDTYSLEDGKQPLNGGAVEAKIVAIEQ